jgi:FixJ family two-component response regulator
VFIEFNEALLPIKKYTVYVIDDDESIRKSFSRLFRSANFNVETYSSLDEFLGRPFKKEDACILMDVCMPGTTGFDLQKRLAELGTTIPVVMVSAKDDYHVRDVARQLGAALFFQKPVDDHALLDAIMWAILGARNT